MEPVDGDRSRAVDVVVEVGDWEHECCGRAIERNEVVDLHCTRWVDHDGQVRLVETHHDLDVPPGEQVRGRVVDLHVVEGAGRTRPLLRLPGGQALRGFDPDDDGHLRDPWTGEVVASGSRDFRVTVRTAEQVDGPRHRLLHEPREVLGGNR